MKKISAIVFCIILAVVLISFSAFSQIDIPTVPLVKPINPKLIKVSGKWNYNTTMPTVRGICPAGSAASGTLTIRKSSGDRPYILTFQSGRVCNPASLCTFHGKLSGNELVFVNEARVDDEGGEVTNAFRLTVLTNGLATGEASSRYLHPEGMECHWNYGITLERKTGK
ncbi:MAG: hypothetical protein PHN98_09570 [Smithellaceae bacterium]|jgi:hypothetical protein|nr:hypothetical protein [Smithellaceae bacterium]